MSEARIWRDAGHWSAWAGSAETLASMMVAGGVAVTKFSIATSRRWKDQQSGEWKEETDWHNVVLWRAENLANYLLKGKQVYVAVARGSVYAPGSPAEFAESYLKHVFGFMGISDVTFVRAEGLGLSPEHRSKSLDGAVATIHSPIRAAA